MVRLEAQKKPAISGLVVQGYGYIESIWAFSRFAESSYSR